MCNLYLLFFLCALQRCTQEDATLHLLNPSQHTLYSLRMLQKDNPFHFFSPWYFPPFNVVFFFSLLFFFFHALCMCACSLRDYALRFACDYFRPGLGVSLCFDCEGPPAPGTWAAQWHCEVEVGPVLRPPSASLRVSRGLPGRQIRCRRVSTSLARSHRSEQRQRQSGQPRCSSSSGSSHQGSLWMQPT